MKHLKPFFLLKKNLIKRSLTLLSTEPNIYIDHKHSVLIRNLIKLKGTEKLAVQGEQVCLKDYKYTANFLLVDSTDFFCVQNPTVVHRYFS